MADKKICHIEDKRTDPFVEYFISKDSHKSQWIYGCPFSQGVVISIRTRYNFIEEFCTTQNPVIKGRGILILWEKS